jgi:hypothetical protein
LANAKGREFYDISLNFGKDCFSQELFAAADLPQRQRPAATSVMNSLNLRGKPQTKLPH